MENLSPTQCFHDLKDIGRQTEIKSVLEKENTGFQFLIVYLSWLKTSLEIVETFNRNFSHINLAQIGINIKYQITSL